MPSESAPELLHLLHRRVAEQAADLPPALDRMMPTTPNGSPADRDSKTLMKSVRSSDRLDLWGRVMSATMHSAANVHDHLRALGILLAPPVANIPVFAHVTVARSAVESAANIAHVLDPDQPLDLRFARGIAFLIADADAALRAAKRIPGNAYMEPPGPHAQRTLNGLLALIERGRIEITPNRNGAPKGVRVTSASPAAPIDLKMADLVTKHYPNLPSVYNLMSGVAHGLPYKLSDNARINDRRAEWTLDPLDVGGSVLAATQAAHTMLRHFGWHRGAPGDPAIMAAANRVTAIDAAMSRFARSRMPLPEPRALRAVASYH